MQNQLASVLLVILLTTSPAKAALLTDASVMEEKGYFYALKLGSKAMADSNDGIDLLNGKMLVSTKTNSPGINVSTPFAKVNIPSDCFVVITVNKQFLKVLNLSNPGISCGISFSPSSGIGTAQAHNAFSQKTGKFHGNTINPKHPGEIKPLLSGQQLLARSYEPLAKTTPKSAPKQVLPNNAIPADTPISQQKSSTKTKPSYFVLSKDPQIAPGTVQIAPVSKANLASTAIMLQQLNKGLNGKTNSDAISSIAALSLVSPWYYKHYDPELYRYYSMGYDYTQGHDLDFTDLGISTIKNSDLSSQNDLELNNSTNSWQLNDADGDIDLGTDLD
jgi:hypothetical protein